MRRWLLGPLAAAVLAACSGERSLEPLGLRYTPPSGMGLLRVEPGPPGRAQFEGGLELVRLAEPLETGLAPAAELEAVRPLLGEAQAAEPLGSRAGDIPLGKVTRHELRHGGSRSLVYLIHAPERPVLLRFTAPQGDYARGERLVERSLGSLKPLR